MKKLIIWALALLPLAGCGVSSSTGSTASTSTTKASSASNRSAAAYLIFTADSQESIVVTVDGKQYNKETIQVKSSGSMKDLQEMAGNIITVTPGSHQVRVTKGGQQVFQQNVTISPQERKIIKL